jgi:hypothetical protein
MAFPKRTVQAATDAVASGGVVRVNPGVYVGNVVIRRPVTLLGPNAGLDPSRWVHPEAHLSSGGGPATVEIEGTSGVTVDGLRIGGLARRGIFAHEAALLTVANSKVENGADGGARLAAVNSALLKNLSFRRGGLSFDVEIVDSHEVTLSRWLGGSILAADSTGVAVTGSSAWHARFVDSSGVVVRESEVNGSLELLGVSGATLTASSLLGLRSPAAVLLAGGTGGTPTTDVKILNNDFPGYGDEGIVVRDAGGTLHIRYNHFDPVAGFRGAALNVEWDAFSGNMDARRNWWGAKDGPSGGFGGSGEAVWNAGPLSAVSVSPWLCGNADQDPGRKGFQPNTSLLSPC